MCNQFSVVTGETNYARAERCTEVVDSEMIVIDTHRRRPYLEGRSRKPGVSGAGQRSRDRGVRVGARSLNRDGRR